MSSKRTIDFEPDKDGPVLKKVATDASHHAEIVGQQYELVRRIMSHSEMPDLKSFSIVSNLWKSVSLREQRTALNRLKPVCFSWQGSRQAMPSSIHQMRSSLVKNICGENKCPKLRIEARFPQVRLLHEALEQCKKNQISMMEAQAAVIFATGDEATNDDDDEADDFEVDMNIIDYIIGCRTLAVTCRGVVNGADELENLEFELPMLPALGMLVFPKFNHIRVTPFEIFEETGASTSDSEVSLIDDEDVFGDRMRVHRRRITQLFTTQEYRDYFHEVTNHKVTFDDQIKCCIIFIADERTGRITLNNGYRMANKFIDSVLCLSNGNAAIGGCIGDVARFSGGRTDGTKGSNSVGLIFSVPKNMSNCMQAFSIILQPNMKGSKNVAAELTKLRDNGFPSAEMTSSCAFMFACCARGEKMHKDTNVELKCFKSLFPETPVVGLFGLGEIGHTYLAPKQHQKLPSINLNTITHMTHQMCTVFVVLAFKQP